VVKFSSFFVSLELVERLVGVSKVVRIFKSPINTLIRYITVHTISRGICAIRPLKNSSGYF
jgi:hypothetical protein